MFCQESATSYLRALGYCVVRFPKSDVLPLLLLAKSGRMLDRFGRLDTVLVGDGSVPLPQIQANLPVANISGRSSSALRLGIGLSILGDVLSAMGASPLGLEAAYGKASRISFEFRDVVEDRVEVAALDRYLSAADLNTHTTNAARLLESDDLYVVTSTLKTDKVLVKAWDSHERAVDLDLSAVQQVVGGQIGVSVSGEQEQLITYAGPARLVFAFQACRVRYVDGDYRSLAPANRVSMRGVGSPDSSGDLLDVGAPFVRLSGG
jgi:hypothetical protein